VFAADHGVHAQGVSPWPQEVTAQMVMNLSSGGAAVNVFARQHDIAVTIVDVGVATPLPPLQGVRRARVADGSADLSAGPAMTRDQAMEALDIGATVAAELVSGGMRCLLTGDMGIANTTPSAALIAAFTGRPAAEVTGRGTGIDDPTLARKAEIVAEAVGRADPTDGLGTLAALGGFEIAALAGYIVGGAAARVPVIVDGVIAGAALLTASRLVPGCEAYAIAGHRSTEPGASAVLETLGIEPLVDLDLRLGEGTGACLAFPFVESAVGLLSDMATFDSAGVTEKAGGVERPGADDPDGTD
jgi:nicotinate-nucleotide--dimethylbenzimidazole phosphoribosyltransferase